jgi:hypothetical protein
VVLSVAVTAAVVRDRGVIGAVQRETWIIDGDLGPYDVALGARLQAADTIVVLDFAFPRCAGGFRVGEVATRPRRRPW